MQMQNSLGGHFLMSLLNEVLLTWEWSGVEGVNLEFYIW